MSNSAGLNLALADLAAGRAPEIEAGREVAELARDFLYEESLSRGSRSAARAERDRLIVELARQHCADLHGIKPKSDQIAAWARRYEGSSWPRERHLTAPPDRLAGRPQELVWRILKTHPDFPRDRQLREILARSTD